MNKVCNRLRLGYLVAWLMDPFRIGTTSKDRDTHFAYGARLRSAAGFPSRKTARDWLFADRDKVEGDGDRDFADLIALEAAHGDLREPDFVLG